MDSKAGTDVRDSNNQDAGSSNAASSLINAGDNQHYFKMVAASITLPEQFQNMLTLVSAETQEAPKLPDGAVRIGTAGDYWKPSKDGWALHAGEGYQKHNRFYDKVKNVTRDDGGNVTVELDSKGKVTYNSDGQIKTTEYPNGSKSEYGWKDGKLNSVALTADGKTKTYTLGTDGKWQDEKGTKMPYAGFKLDEGGTLNGNLGDSEFRQFTDGSKREYTVARRTNSEGVRTSETVTSSDGKLTFVRDFDSTGNVMTRERASLEGKLMRDSTYKGGKSVREVFFNEDGKKDSQTDFDGDGEATRFLKYDKTGNVTSKSEYKGPMTTTTAYDAAGHKVSELITRGSSLVCHRKFNKEQLPIEEKSWDNDGKSLGKKTFAYENNQKVKESYFAPPAEILRSEITFVNGVKSVETHYQTEAPWSLLGKKQLETTYTPTGAKSRETKYHLGGTKDVETDFDTTDPTGKKKLRERRYGPGETVREELPYATDGVTLLPPRSSGSAPIPVPKR